MSGGSALGRCVAGAGSNALLTTATWVGKVGGVHCAKLLYEAVADAIYCDASQRAMTACGCGGVLRQLASLDETVMRDVHAL